MDALEVPHIATRAAKGAFLQHSAAYAPRRAKPRLEATIWRVKNYTHFHREHKLAVDFFCWVPYREFAQSARKPPLRPARPFGHFPLFHR